MVKEVPIFDVLAHPCLDGNYLGRGVEASFEALAADLKNTQVKWACAVGLEKIGGYSHENFVQACKQHVNIFPIAAFNPKFYADHETTRNALEELRHLGFYGIKLHPRISQFEVASIHCERVLEACEEMAFPVFLCTYHYGSLETCPLFETLSNLLQKFRKLKLLLVHAGAVEVLKYMELARAFPNVLLDLSMTMMKYEGSSIDLDLQFMFENFDRRICVGSDHPEYTLQAFADRFNFFAKTISLEKKQNIAYKNIAKFLDIESLLTNE